MRITAVSSGRRSLTTLQGFYGIAQAEHAASSAYGTVVDTVDALWAKATGGVRAAGSTAWRGATKAGAKAKQATGTAARAVKSTAHTVADTGEHAWDAAKGGVGKVARGAKHGAEEVAHTVHDTVAGAYERTKDATGAIKDRTVRTVKGATRATTKAVRTAATTAKCVVAGMTEQAQHCFADAKWNASHPDDATEDAYNAARVRDCYAGRFWTFVTFLTWTRACAPRAPMQAYESLHHVADDVRDNVAHARRDARGRYESSKHQHAHDEDQAPLLPHRGHQAAERLAKQALKPKKGRSS